jgi:hypothetical protein
MPVIARYEGATFIIADEYRRAEGLLTGKSGWQCRVTGRTAWQFKTDGTIVAIRPANNCDFSIDELYLLIGDSEHREGPFDTSPTMIEDALLICHDEAWVLDPPMKFNVHASLIAGQAIAGDCVIIPRRTLL